MAGAYEKLMRAIESLESLTQSEDYHTAAEEFIESLSIMKAQTPDKRQLNSMLQNLCQQFNHEDELRRFCAVPPDDTCAEKTSDLQQLFRCALHLRQVLEKLGVLAPFLSEVNRQDVKSKRTTAAPRSSKPATQFSYAEITMYRQTVQEESVSQLRGAPLLEGVDPEVTLTTVQARGLLDCYLYTLDGSLTYQEFFDQFIADKGFQVISIFGELGVGKSQLTQWLICERIAEIKGSVILFIGRRSSSATSEGAKLLKDFLNQRFENGGKVKKKFFIVIDEPEADKKRDISWEKLVRAAKKYQATILLLVRDGAETCKLDNLLQAPHSSVTLQMPSQAIPLPAGCEEILASFGLPNEMISELRKLPLFRLPIDNTLWRLKNQTLSSDAELKKPFQTPYALLEWLYVHRLREKEAQTGKNAREADKDAPFYQRYDKLFQHIAMSLAANGGTVSWKAGVPCTPDGWDPMIEDGFIKNVLDIDIRPHEMDQSTIHSFHFRSFYHYFLTRAVFEALVEGKDIQTVLSLGLSKMTENSFQATFTAGLGQMANDKKRTALKNLREIRHQSENLSAKEKAEASYLNRLLEESLHRPQH